MPLLHYLEQAQFQQADFEAALETELAMIGLSMASIVRSEAEELAIQAARLIDGGADANPAVMMGLIALRECSRIDERQMRSLYIAWRRGCQSTCESFDSKANTAAMRKSTTPQERSPDC